MTRFSSQWKLVVNAQTGSSVDSVILDTDILSEIFKERNDQVPIHARQLLQYHRKLTFTGVSAAELLFGLYANDSGSVV